MRSDLADAVIRLVADVEVAGRIHRHPERLVQTGAGGRAAVAGEGKAPIARYRGDNPGGIHLPDAVTPNVGGDEEVAGRIHCHVSRAAVAGKDKGSVARYRGDNPGSIHLADAVITPVGDVEVARRIHRHPRHPPAEVQRGAGGWTVIPGESRGHCARYSGNNPGGIDLADAAVVAVGDVEVSGRIHRHPSWEVQTGADSGAAIAGEASNPIAGHGGNNPGSIDLADTVIISVGDVEVSGRIHRHPVGEVQRGAGSRNTFAGEGSGPIAARKGGDNPGSIHLADTVIRKVGNVEVAGRIHRHPARVLQTGADSLAAVAAERSDPIASHRGDDRASDYGSCGYKRVNPVGATNYGKRASHYGKTGVTIRVRRSSSAPIEGDRASTHKI